jgi:hypothetical protein
MDNLDNDSKELAGKFIKINNANYKNVIFEVTSVDLAVNLMPEGM